MEGKRATTYRGKRQTQLQEFGAMVLDEPIVIEDNLTTSWNPSTAIHVAFKLLEHLTTKENASTIKNLMGF